MTSQPRRPPSLGDGEARSCSFPSTLLCERLSDVLGCHEKFWLHFFCFFIHSASTASCSTRGASLILTGSPFGLPLKPCRASSLAARLGALSAPNYETLFRFSFGAATFLFAQKRPLPVAVYLALSSLVFVYPLRTLTAFSIYHFCLTFITPLLTLVDGHGDIEGWPPFARFALDDAVDLFLELDFEACC